METVTASMWQRSKLLIKGGMIMLLVLLLMIPTYFIQQLVEEREQRQKEAFAEISGKWAGAQNVMGPVIVLPYLEKAADGSPLPTSQRKYAYVLPDLLHIESTVNPETRHRGIFQVMLYSSTIKMTGRFNGFSAATLNIDLTGIQWQEAYLCMSITDQRGLRDALQLSWNGSPVFLEPVNTANAVMREGFSAPLPNRFDQPVDFSVTMTINGSGQLLFTPIGKETSVTMSSTWPDPSFTGSQLPQYTINDTGFVATWKSMSHTRKFPQAWADFSPNLGEASFGADLFIPVNGYQRTMRSVKYASLCILLTFGAFFLIETVNKRSVHPFQYALVGLALVLFYTLLLSFSEYTGFNVAYAIASAATIGLIGWFVKGLLQSGRLSAFLVTVLVITYSYVFTILQLEDYALLLGSIGLFLSLAITMYFSRKISW